MIKFEIYTAGAVYTSPEYRWRAKASNGRIMADGAESYYKKGNVRRAVLRFIELLGATDFEIVELDR